MERRTPREAGNRTASPAAASGERGARESGLRRGRRVAGAKRALFLLRRRGRDRRATTVATNRATEQSISGGHDDEARVRDRERVPVARAKGDGGGNPAAVVVLVPDDGPWPPDAVMQAAARELGLERDGVREAGGRGGRDGATAHRMYDEHEDEDYDVGSPESCFAQYVIRWFTPTCEINLCGHASMATAHEIFRAPGNEHVTKIGFLYGKPRDVCDGTQVKAAYESLFVWKDLDGGVESSYAMALPEERARSFPDALGEDGFLHPQEIVNMIRGCFGDDHERSNSQSSATSKAKYELRYNFIGDLFFIIDTDDAPDEVFEACFDRFMNHAPDLKAISEVGRCFIEEMKYDFDMVQGFRGLCVLLTVKNRPNHSYDFYTRWFGPDVGIDEDPVTGSAASGYARFLDDKLPEVVGKKRGCQMSKPRGDITVSLSDNPYPDTDVHVEVVGKVATRSSGVLEVSVLKDGDISVVNRRNS